MDIRKLACWPELQALGFEPIRYRAHGKIVSVGASLRQKLKDVSGKEFYADVVTIEPATNGYSDGKSYHITGVIKTPFTETLYQYKYGRKEEIYRLKERMNDFVAARDILKTVKLMLK